MVEMTFMIEGTAFRRNIYLDSESNWNVMHVDIKSFASRNTAMRKRYAKGTHFVGQA